MRLLDLRPRNLQSPLLALSLALWGVAPGCGDNVGLTDGVSISGGLTSTSEVQTSSEPTTVTPTSEPPTTTDSATSSEPTSTSTGSSSTTDTGTSTSTGPGTSTGSSSDTSTGSGDTGSSTDTGGAGCCAEQGGPGCGDPDIEACLCAQDSFCCETQWDALCASEAQLFGCTECGFVPCCDAKRDPGCATDPGLEAFVCGDQPECCTNGWTASCVAALQDVNVCPVVDQDCCLPGMAPGCVDTDVQDCVCATMPECCADAWTDACVSAVDALACGTCGGPPPEGECCEAGLGPGCLDDTVEACVCAQLPECCSDVWNADCAVAVEALACGSCGGGADVCCSVQDGPGCGDPDIEACVCAQDSFCCDTQWDDLCALEVEDLGCATCPVPPGPCCAEGVGPSCEDADVAACVCAVDPTCCSDVWTAECAAMVEGLACGSCDTCCSPQDTPSCSDPLIAECVCAFDDFCCNVQWDGLCVGEVEDLGCGVCG